MSNDSEAIKTTAQQLAATTRNMAELGRALQESMARNMAPFVAAAKRSQASREAVEALASYLILRDWPSTARQPGSRKYEYRTMAAAIIAGEAWAIRKAWPEAASDIVGMRPA